MSLRTLNARGIMAALGALALMVVRDVSLKLGQAVYPVAANLAVQFQDLPRTMSALVYKPKQEAVRDSVDPLPFTANALVKSGSKAKPQPRFDSKLDRISDAPSPPLVVGKLSYLRDAYAPPPFSLGFNNMMAPLETSYIAAAPKSYFSRTAVRRPARVLPTCMRTLLRDSDEDWMVEDEAGGKVGGGGGGGGFASLVITIKERLVFDFNSSFAAFPRSEYHQRRRPFFSSWQTFESHIHMAVASNIFGSSPPGSPPKARFPSSFGGTGGVGFGDMGEWRDPHADKVSLGLNPGLFAKVKKKEKDDDDTNNDYGLGLSSELDHDLTMHGDVYMYLYTCPNPATRAIYSNNDTNDNASGRSSTTEKCPVDLTLHGDLYMYLYTCPNPATRAIYSNNDTNDNASGRSSTTEKCPVDLTLHGDVYMYLYTCPNPATGAIYSHKNNNDTASGLSSKTEECPVDLTLHGGAYMYLYACPNLYYVPSDSNTTAGLAAKKTTAAPAPAPSHKGVPTASLRTLIAQQEEEAANLRAAEEVMQHMMATLHEAFPFLASFDLDNPDSISQDAIQQATQGMDPERFAQFLAAMEVMAQPMKAEIEDAVASASARLEQASAILAILDGIDPPDPRTSAFSDASSSASTFWPLYLTCAPRSWAYLAAPANATTGGALSHTQPPTSFSPSSPKYSTTGTNTSAPTSLTANTTDSSSSNNNNKNDNGNNTTSTDTLTPTPIPPPLFHGDLCPAPPYFTYGMSAHRADVTCACVSDTGSSSLDPSTETHDGGEHDLGFGLVDREEEEVLEFDSSQLESNDEDSSLSLPNVDHGQDLRLLFSEVASKELLGEESATDVELVEAGGVDLEEAQEGEFSLDSSSASSLPGSVPLPVNEDLDEVDVKEGEATVVGVGQEVNEVPLASDSLTTATFPSPDIDMDKDAEPGHSEASSSMGETISFDDRDDKDGPRPESKRKEEQQEYLGGKYVLWALELLGHIWDDGVLHCVEKLIDGWRCIHDGFPTTTQEAATLLDRVKHLVLDEALLAWVWLCALYMWLSVLFTDKAKFAVFLQGRKELLQVIWELLLSDPQALWTKVYEGLVHMSKEWASSRRCVCWFFVLVSLWLLRRRVRQQMPQQREQEGGAIMPGHANGHVVAHLPADRHGDGQGQVQGHNGVQLDMQAMIAAPFSDQLGLQQQHHQQQHQQQQLLPPPQQQEQHHQQQQLLPPPQQQQQHQHHHHQATAQLPPPTGGYAHGGPLPGTPAAVPGHTHAHTQGHRQVQGQGHGHGRSPPSTCARSGGQTMRRGNSGGDGAQGQTPARTHTAAPGGLFHGLPTRLTSRAGSYERNSEVMRLICRLTRTGRPVALFWPLRADGRLKWRSLASMSEAEKQVWQTYVDWSKQQMAAIEQWEREKMEQQERKQRHRERQQQAVLQAQQAQQDLDCDDWGVEESKGDGDVGPPQWRHIRPHRSARLADRPPLYEQQQQQLLPQELEGQGLTAGTFSVRVDSPFSPMIGPEEVDDNMIDGIENCEDGCARPWKGPAAGLPSAAGASAVALSFPRCISTAIHRYPFPTLIDDMPLQEAFAWLHQARMDFHGRAVPYVHLSGRVSWYNVAELSEEQREACVSSWSRFENGCLPRPPLQSRLPSLRLDLSHRLLMEQDFAETPLSPSAVPTPAHIFILRMWPMKPYLKRVFHTPTGPLASSFPGNALVGYFKNTIGSKEEAARLRYGMTGATAELEFDPESGGRGSLHLKLADGYTHRFHCTYSDDRDRVCILLLPDFLQLRLPPTSPWVAHLRPPTSQTFEYQVWERRWGRRSNNMFLLNLESMQVPERGGDGFAVVLERHFPLMEIKVEVPVEPLPEIVVQAIVDGEVPPPAPPSSSSSSSSSIATSPSSSSSSPSSSSSSLAEETSVQATVPDEEGHQLEEEHDREHEQPSGTRLHFPSSNTPRLTGAAGVMLPSRPSRQSRLAPQLGHSPAAAPVSGRVSSMMSPLVPSQEALVHDLMGRSSSMEDSFPATGIDIPFSESHPCGSLYGHIPASGLIPIPTSTPSWCSLESMAQSPNPVQWPTSIMPSRPFIHPPAIGTDLAQLHHGTRLYASASHRWTLMEALTEPFDDSEDDSPSLVCEKARMRMRARVQQQQEEAEWILPRAIEEEAGRRREWIESQVRSYRWDYFFKVGDEAGKEIGKIFAWQREQQALIMSLGDMDGISCTRRLRDMMALGWRLRNAIYEREALAKKLLDQRIDEWRRDGGLDVEDREEAWALFLSKVKKA